MAYDEQNIFAKILRGEIPCDMVYESEHSLAFNDINPGRPVHVLVIPKGEYVDMNDFSAHANAAEMADLLRTIGEVAKICGVDQSGFRLMSNTGADGHQEVMHLHFHIFGGAPSGPMIKRVEKL